MKFRYCRCGCLGHTSKVSKHWMFLEDSGAVALHRGHGRAFPLIGKFTTMQSAIDAAQEDLDRR